MARPWREGSWLSAKEAMTKPGKGPLSWSERELNESLGTQGSETLIALCCNEVPTPQ